MADKVTRVLLEIVALDKATSILKAMMGGLQSWADTMNGVGAETQLTSEQLEAVQVRLQGASDAYDASLETQAAALGKLEAAQASVAEAQQAAVGAQLEAQQAAMEAAAATGDEAVAMEAYAKTAAASAAAAAEAVKASVDAQIVAYDKLMAADDLVEKRNAQLAEATVAANGEEEESAAGLGKLGPVMLAAGAAAAYLTVKSVNLAANFQSSMTKLVTSAGESQSAMDMVSAGVLKISDQTGISAEDLAKALYYVDSAGFHAADSLTVLTAAAKGARDEQADAATVTNAVTTVLKNYNMSADQSTMVMNQMIQAVSLGKTNLQDFASALSNVLPIAAANNISFAQVGAALAAMTAKGETAQRAADNLSFSIRALQKPNGVAITELGQLGLTATDVQKSLGTGPDGLSNTLLMLSNTVLSKMGPAGTLLLSTFNQSKDAAAKAKQMFDAMPPSLQKLAGGLENGSISANNWRLAIRNLDPTQQKLMQQFATMYTNANAFSQVVTSRATPATQTYATAMSNLMGGAAGLNTALMLVGQQGVGDFTSNVQKMDAVAGQANKEVDGWSTVQGTFNQKMSEAKQTIINTGISIGTVLLPYVTKMISAVMSILTPLAAWITAHQKLLAGILAIAGPLLALIGIFLTVSKVVGIVKASVEAFRAVMLAIEETDPIVLALTAVVVAIILVIKYWKQIKQVLEDVWNWIKGASKDVADFFVRIWKDVAGFVKPIWDDIANFFKSTWNSVSQFFKGIWGDISNWFKGVFKDISAPVKKEWDRIYNDLSQIWSELVTLWNDTGGKLVSFISDNWNTIEDITNAVWTPIYDQIKLIWTLIYDTIKLIVNDIKTDIKVAWDLIQGIFHVTWDLVSGIVKTAWDVIYGIIKAAVDVIVGILKAAWDAVVAVVKVAWDYVTGIINTALDFIKDILKVFIDLVTGKWGQMWDDIKKTVTDVLNNVKTFVGNILNDIVGFFESAGKNVIHGFINAIESMGGSAWNAMSDLSNTISRFFSDAAKWLINAGTDLVKGLINGIENWASHLWDTLSNLAGGILGKIGKFLGLGSPSRITHQHGQWLVEGLINGINASAGKAANAARNMALGVISASSGTLGNITLAGGGIGRSDALFAGAAGAGAGRPSVTVTNDLRGAQIAGPASINWITDQINRNFVQKVVPTAGITTRRTGG